GRVPSGRRLAQAGDGLLAAAAPGRRWTRRRWTHGPTFSHPSDTVGGTRPRGTHGRVRAGAEPSRGWWELRRCYGGDDRQAGVTERDLAGPRWQLGESGAMVLAGTAQAGR